MSSHKAVCIKASQRVVGHRFSLSQRETMQVEYANARECLQYQAPLKINTHKLLRHFEQGTGDFLGYALSHKPN
jgi:hypothetical protein